MVLNPSLKYMPKYSGSDYELKVSRCKMDDKGEYIVRAVNSFGSKEESAALSVERELFKKIKTRLGHQLVYMVAVWLSANALVVINKVPEWVTVLGRVNDLDTELATQVY